MFLPNRNALHGKPLDAADAETLGIAGADTVERFLAHRDNHVMTPLHALPALAGELGLAALHVKDEGFRLGLGSFKALGGAYAVLRLVLEEASKRLGGTMDVEDLDRSDVRSVAAKMTFACATDGNHGRSVAQGAELAGARAVIFVHAGVSDERISAIARYGAEMVNVDGNYDDSVRQAANVAAEKGWTVVSDTSWPGYERIPGLVMQGYTAIVREALQQMREPPTHVFVRPASAALLPRWPAISPLCLAMPGQPSSSSSRHARPALSRLPRQGMWSRWRTTSRRSWPCLNATRPRRSPGECWRGPPTPS